MRMHHDHETPPEPAGPGIDEKNRKLQPGPDVTGHEHPPPDHRVETLEEDHRREEAIVAECPDREAGPLAADSQRGRWDRARSPPGDARGCGPIRRLSTTPTAGSSFCHDQE